MELWDMLIIPTLKIEKNLSFLNFKQFTMMSKLIEKKEDLEIIIKIMKIRKYRAFEFFDYIGYHNENFFPFREHKKQIFNLLKNPPKDLENFKSHVSLTEAEMIYQATKDQKYHRLYYEQPSSFFRKGREGTLGLVRRGKLSKTGSQTTVLGGTLTEKVIIRIIPDFAFQSWKKAFEAEDFWKSLGFDYIPVEPILHKNGKLRAYKTKKGLWRVSTKVLGPSLAAVINTHEYKKYRLRLELMKARIISGLRKLNIKHGHLHDGNFCVEFHQGKIRLYVIDFDEALS